MLMASSDLASVPTHIWSKETGMLGARFCDVVLGGISQTGYRGVRHDSSCPISQNTARFAIEVPTRRHMTLHEIAGGVHEPGVVPPHVTRGPPLIASFGHSCRVFIYQIYALRFRARRTGSLLRELFPYVPGHMMESKIRGSYLPQEQYTYVDLVAHVKFGYSGESATGPVFVYIE